MRAIRLTAPLFAACALIACGTDSTMRPRSDDGGGSGSDAGGLDASTVPGSFTVTLGPITVPGATERTQCVIKRVGNTEMLRVGQIQNVLGAHSHHFIVYRTAETVEQPEPFDCSPFIDTLDPSKGSPLMVTQRADETLTLPEGVAFSFEPDQMVRLELHYINITAEPVEITASTTFVPIAPERFVNEADFLFIGNPDVDIAGHSTATLGPTFFPLPAMLEGSKFFGITGHTHQWGTNVWVATAPGEAGPDTPVYDVPDWNWDEPETVYADPPFEIPSGGGFHFTCEWNNAGPSRVGFGESANDEMCFFWAYYYPSRGAFVCGHTDQISGGYDVCCPGDVACSFVF